MKYAGIINDVRVLLRLFFFYEKHKPKLYLSIAIAINI